VVGCSDRSWHRLSALTPRPDVLIIAGDQVYVDATAGLFDPRSMDDALRQAYVSLRDNAGYQAAVHIKRFVMIDDHEIEDDWEPLDGTRAVDRSPFLELRAGVAEYINESRASGVAQLDRNRSPTMLDFAFERGDHRFRMVDTRTRREGRDVGNIGRAKLITDDQMQALREFIEAGTDDRPAFVVTPAMLLPRTLVTTRDIPSALHGDGWDGYPASLRRVLAMLCETGRNNIVFLSGDAHLSCAARAEVARSDGSKRVLVHSVHSSALYAPYPFANSVEEDFIRAETFAFTADAGEGERPYTCSVQTCFPKVDGRLVGDGFALLTPVQENGRWRVEVLFDGERGRSACTLDLRPSPA
jgi:phosphodiesterase/alkaline phosphatase D-like protein